MINVNEALMQSYQGAAADGQPPSKESAAIKVTTASIYIYFTLNASALMWWSKGRRPGSSFR